MRRSGPARLMPGGSAKAPWFRSRSGLVLIAFLAIAAFFVVTEHFAHALGALPYVLLLACPLLHFLHGGHGRHGGHRDPGDPRRPANGR